MADPFVLHGFELSDTGLKAAMRKRPSYADWASIGAFLQQCEKSIAWWVGDWLVYGETNFDEKVYQAVEATGLEAETIKQYAWVAENVPARNRVAELSFSHHRAVADVTEVKQVMWLKRAVRDELNVKDFVAAIQADKRRENREQQIFWLQVECTSLRDRDRLAKRMREEKRMVKYS